MQVASSAMIFAGISPRAILQNRQSSAIAQLLGSLDFFAARLDRPRQRRERRPHHGQRRDPGRLEPQHRMPKAHRAKPGGLELFQLRVLHPAFGPDHQCDRLEKTRAMLARARPPLRPQPPPPPPRQRRRRPRAGGAGAPPAPAGGGGGAGPPPPRGPPPPPPPPPPPLF